MTLANVEDDNKDDNKRLLECLTASQKVQNYHSTLEHALNGGYLHDKHESMTGILGFAL